MSDSEPLETEGPENAQPTRMISLQDLCEGLQAKGDPIRYDSLSDLIKQDDIAEQLQIGGTRAKRLIPSDVIDILAAFLPDYRAAKGRLPQASQMLRSFLQARMKGPEDNLPATTTPPGVPMVPPELPEPDARELAVIQGREAGRAHGLAASDEVFTADEAAQFMRITVRQLRHSQFKPYTRIGNSARGDRWRKSDLLDLPQARRSE